MLTDSLVAWLPVALAPVTGAAHDLVVLKAVRTALASREDVILCEDDVIRSLMGVEVHVRRDRGGLAFEDEDVPLNPADNTGGAVTEEELDAVTVLVEAVSVAQGHASTTSVACGAEDFFGRVLSNAVSEPVINRSHD